jgi:hypothetical protein
MPAYTKNVGSGQAQKPLVHHQPHPFPSVLIRGHLWLKLPAFHPLQKNFFTTPQKHQNSQLFNPHQTPANIGPIRCPPCFSSFCQNLVKPTAHYEHDFFPATMSPMITKRSQPPKARGTVSRSRHQSGRDGMLPSQTSFMAQPPTTPATDLNALFPTSNLKSETSNRSLGHSRLFPLILASNLACKWLYSLTFRLISHKKLFFHFDRRWRRSNPVLTMQRCNDLTSARLFRTPHSEFRTSVTSSVTCKYLICHRLRHLSHLFLCFFTAPNPNPGRLPPLFT